MYSRPLAVPVLHERTDRFSVRIAAEAALGTVGATNTIIDAVGAVAATGLFRPLTTPDEMRAQLAANWYESCFVRAEFAPTVPLSRPADLVRAIITLVESLERSYLTVSPWELLDALVRRSGGDPNGFAPPSLGDPAAEAALREFVRGFRHVRGAKIALDRRPGLDAFIYGLPSRP